MTNKRRYANASEAIRAMAVAKQNQSAQSPDEDFLDLCASLRPSSDPRIVAYERKISRSSVYQEEN